MGTEQQNQDKPVSLVINNKEEQLNNLNLEFKNDVPLPPSGNKKLEKISATRRTIAQVIATVGFGTLLFGIGLIFSMPTVVNGSLMKNKNEALYLDDNAASWFGSIIFISQPLGSVASGFLQDTFGRKRCMMIVNIPQVVGWIIIYFSTNIVHLYFAATVLGLSLGFMEAPALSYIGEIAEPRLRGMLSSLSGSFAGFGILAELFIGALTDWRTTCAISATVPVLAFITILLIPESPTWLIMQGRISEAEQALCWLRGWVHPVYVRKEFLALLNYANSPGVKEMTNMKSTTDSQEKTQYKQDVAPVKSSGILNTFALLLEPKLYRPLTMVLIYFFISHNVSLLGVRPVLVHIFETIGMPLKAEWVLVISGSLQITGALIGMFCMKWLGKRKVNFMSLLTSVICCYLLTITISIKGMVAWVPFALFCILFFATGFGVVPLPWVLLSELFPLEGRGIAGGLAAALSYFQGFIVTKSYINLADWFGMNGTFSIYGTVGLLGLFYLYFCLPETEGKTLEEIEEFFKDKKDKKPPETSQLPNNTV